MIFQEQPQLIVGDQDVQLLAHANELWNFRWEDVIRIEAYKKDMFSVDLVCLDFFVKSSDLSYRTHEDMKGFPDLRDRMQRHFSSIKNDWWQQVTRPPFAGNHTILYEQNKGSSLTQK